MSNASTGSNPQLAEKFLQNIYALHGGERVRKCLQCGNCTASCPTSKLMDYSPRQIFAALRAGMLDKVLQSNTIWMCASCYNCQVRCPVQIKITDVMYELKRMATEQGMVRGSHTAPVLTSIFIDLINQDGRNSEGVLGRQYYMKGKGLVKSLAELPFALRMVRKGRLHLFQRERIKDPGKLARALGKIGGK